MVGLLERHPDALVVVGAPIGERASEHRQPAAVLAQQADEDLLRGALAGAAGAEEPEDLAAGDVEGDAVDRGVAGTGVGETQVGDLDQRRHVELHPGGNMPAW